MLRQKCTYASLLKPPSERVVSLVAVRKRTQTPHLRRRVTNNDRSRMRAGQNISASTDQNRTVTGRASTSARPISAQALTRRLRTGHVIGDDHVITAGGRGRSDSDAEVGFQVNKPPSTRLIASALTNRTRTTQACQQTGSTHKEPNHISKASQSNRREQ